MQLSINYEASLVRPPAITEIIKHQAQNHDSEVSLYVSTLVSVTESPRSSFSATTITDCERNMAKPSKPLVSSHLSDALMMAMSMMSSYRDYRIDSQGCIKKSIIR